MSKIEISIIVPVYKAEKYLHRCIDSILCQTFPNFELLLIDDGSPDTSGMICDEYAAKDSRIRVFHKENGGVSSARQCGIDNAEGEYSIHADPDDWVEPDMLECMYAKAKETGADMILCDFIVEQKDHTTIRVQKPQSIDPDTVLSNLFTDVLHGSLCNKLIRHSLYNKYNIQFPTINLLEDKFVVCELLRHGCTVTYLNRAFYHYDCFINENSSVHRLTKDKIRQLICFVEYFENVLDNKIFSDALYIQKVLIKEWVLCDNCLSNQEFIDLFKEVNERYILENQLKLRLIGSLGKDRHLGVSRRILFSIYRKCVRKIYRPLKRKKH